MPKVNGERLLADLRRLRTIGARGVGVVRPAFSEADMQARRWLAQRYQEAGLDASIDGLGNVFGRSRNPGRVLLVGSHSDTQPTGGWLDGALGVAYGLEAARALAEDPATRALPLDAVSFQDEESRFVGCLGSRSFTGQLAADAEARAADGDGLTLADARKSAGLADAPRMKIEPSRHAAFLEAHIEQGPDLEATGKRIGVVSGIVGLRGLKITFKGQQNHAGTTMMARRRDAATALYEFAHRVNQEFPRIAAARTVWTMGRAKIEPNATSIVPGYAELDLQFRDASVGVLDALQKRALDIGADMNARGKVEVNVDASRAPIAPAAMDDALRSHVAAAAEAHAPGGWIEMPSGAFHDAGIMSAALPSAMLFIPSIGGISHDFAEDSHDADIVLGCEVLVDASARILRALNG